MTSEITLDVVDVFYGHNCNLACVGCNTGCDIINTTEYDPSLKEVLLSITNLSKYVQNIRQVVSLVGGESLLYWEEKVVPIIHHVREKIPLACIAIVTNGLLLHKFKDDVLKLMITIGNMKLVISDHLYTFSTTDTTKIRYHNNLNNFLSDPRIKKINDLLYTLDNDVEILIQRYESGFFAQYIKIDNKLKPFATNDPANSFKYGCNGPTASFLINSKLYKCSRFGVLYTVLSNSDQLSDPDWQKYLKYAPIDLQSDNVLQQLKLFEENEGKHIDLCDMCPNNQIINISMIPQTRENVLKRDNTI